MNGVEIINPVFVDDMNGMGDKEFIEDMGRKMCTLEHTKGFTFNNSKGKTELLKIDFRKKKKETNNEEDPEIHVRKGILNQTDLCAVPDIIFLIIFLYTFHHAYLHGSYLVRSSN